MPAPTRSTPVVRATGGGARHRVRPPCRPLQQSVRRRLRRARKDWPRLLAIGVAGFLTVTMFAFLTAGRTPPAGVLAADAALVAGTTAITALPVPPGRQTGRQTVRPAGQQAGQPAVRPAVLVPEAEEVLDALPAQPGAALSRLPAAGKGAARPEVSGRPGRPVTGPVGTCRGGDTALFRNGEIPRSALCPLRGATGHLLRADAAFAFNRLTQAYSRQFGTSICVTDSYRDRATQVRLRAQKPQLAAVPGTSRHGWGVATDLCGGIEDFGSAPHTWMLRNAPRFGWQHPTWARADGTKPEPWHWEFAG